MPVAELLIGVCLLTGVVIVAADAAATAIGFVFVWFQLVKPAGVPCRCFGRLDDHVGYGAAVARSAALLLAGAIATGIRLSTGTPLSIAHIHQSFVYPIVGAITALATIAAAAVWTEVATR